MCIRDSGERVRAAGNAGANALTALAVHLPDAAKRDVLLVAVEAARLERLETS